MKKRLVLSGAICGTVAAFWFIIVAALDEVLYGGILSLPNREGWFWIVPPVLLAVWAIAASLGTVHYGPVITVLLMVWGGTCAFLSMLATRLHSGLHPASIWIFAWGFTLSAAGLLWLEYGLLWYNARSKSEPNVLERRTK